MSSLNFGSTAILNLKQFSYIFLADWLVAIIAILFVVFFLDRLVGFVLSQIIGWTVWKKYRVYFSVSSVKFSIFGGRIFFKNLVYIGENEAISVLHGSYTWRYWLKRVRRNRLEYPEEDQSLPCRHLIRMTGVEWFIYNQSSAYDFDDSPLSPKSSTSTATMSNSKQEFTKAEQFLFKALPTTVEIDTFAIICGNQSTSTLMVSFSKVASVEVDVTRPSVSYDRYKLRYSIRAVKPKIYFTVNPDYNPEIAKMSKSRIAHWYSLQDVFSNIKKHVKSSETRDSSLRKPSEDNAAQFGDDTPTEHQKVTRLLDCDSLNIEYFYDVPDICVKEDSKDPEMGYIVVLTNASINYGPWSERRRVEFYELFFPSKYKTYTPITGRVGGLRQISSYTTDIRFEGTTTLRIPTREFSKVGEGQTLSNAAGENNDDNITNTEIPYGWLELVVAERSSLMLTMDILPQNYGFKFTANANLISAQLRTSVNHTEVMSTDLFRINIEQTTPLQWNALQTWNFSHELRKSRIFILREHINLFVDLSEDLGSGQRIPYELFIPTIYNLDLDFHDVKLYVNVNPLNIISNPTSLAENVFLVFNSSHWHTSVKAPFEQVCPVMNTITTVSETNCLKMDIMTPTWHTLDAFLESQTVGIAHDFDLGYNLTYYADMDFSRVEGHQVNIEANKFTLVSFGAVIDYLVSVIDNYGGVDFKFQTPEEFISREFEPPQYSFTRTSVDVDYRITSDVKNVSFVLPANLYSAKDNLNLFTESWTADLRFTNYYMDLQTEFSPVKGYINHDLDQDQILNLHGPERGVMILNSDELVIQSHRMFGLPPAEPTYVCKWDINFGDLILNIPVESLSIFPRVGRSFAHGFSNIENRPFFEIYKPKDVTFVSIIIDSISFKLVVQDDSIHINTSMITAKFHDLANERYSDKIFLDIPFIHLFSFNQRGSILDFTTSFKTTVFTIKGNHKEHYEQQQEHIMLQDCLYHRCPFFLDKKRRLDPRYGNQRSDSQPHVVPAISMPMMPAQLTRETLLVIDPDMGVFNYKGTARRDSGSDTASEESLYGSGIYSDNSTSSSDLSSEDGSIIVKKRVKAISGEPENSRYLPPSEWEMPFNDAKDVRSEPIFSTNAQEGQDILHRIEDGDASDIISELGTIVGTLHTDLVEVIQRAFSLVCEDSIETMLDELESRLVDEMKVGASKETLKVFLQVPHINITVEGDNLLECDENTSSIFLELATVQVLGNVSSKRDPVSSSLSKKFTANFERIIAGVRTEGTEATRFDLSNPEAFFSEDDSGSSIDWNAGTLDFTTKANQLEDLALFLKRLVLSMSKNESENNITPLNNADLVYSILIAGQKAGIERDPYVLSRTPAVQIRNNIRGDISWRIMMRLRYLFNNVPSMKISKSPHDAKKRVLEVLDNWRSWERIVPLQQSRILSEFENGSPGAAVFPKLSITVESFSTVLKYNDTQEDYLVFDEFEIHGALKKPTNNWMKCLFGVSAQRARLGITWDIIEVVQIIEQIKLASEPHKEPEIPNSEETSSGGLIFQAVMSLNICDWSADLKAKSIKSEFQNKDLQFVTTIDYREYLDTLFASGVFSNSQAAIRAYSPGPKLELLDYLMENVSIGFSTNTSQLKGPLWLSVNVGYLNLAINATFEELCYTAQLILDQEYGTVKRMVKELTLKRELKLENSPPNETCDYSSTTRALKLLLNTNLKISEVVFRVQAMRDLEFVFSGTNIELSGRMPDEDALLLNLDWSAYILRVMSEQSHCLGSFLVEGTNILARADLEALAFDIKYSVSSVNLETSSVLSTLRYMEKPQVVERTKATQQALERTIATFRQHTDDSNQMSPSILTKDDRNSCWNYIFNISQVRIFLPVDTFSFIFIFDEIGVEHKSFEWTQTGACVSKMSYTHVNISEFSAQLRKGNDATKILSLQLLGSYQEVPELSSIFFTSDFCRISLCPSTVGAIFAAFDKVRANSRHLLPESNSEKEDNETRKILDLFVGIKAAIALRNFSVDWLTEQSGTSVHGITAGFELLQVNLVSHQCRMDLVGLAVTPQNSPWKSLEANKYENYAHLPHVEIVGVLLKEEKYIDVKINGESLYVNMRPSVGILISSMVNSVAKCRELLDLNIKRGENCPPNYLQATDTVLPKLKASINGKKSGLMDYSLHLKTNFEAASFKLWDDNLPENAAELMREAPEPSIELNSPDMVTVIEYLHKESGRDCAFIDVWVSKSSNQVFPKALQELKALFNYSTTFYGATPMEPKKIQDSPINMGESTGAFGNIQSELISRLLKGVDATIRVKLDAQSLCISCQPFSKITTTVSTDMIELLLTTPITGEDVYVSLAGKVHGAKLSLRHAHSHGHSAYGGISEVDFAIMHKLSGHNNSERIMVGLNIGKPEFELRAAQIKDIGLFIDIWSPRRDTPEPDNHSHIAADDVGAVSDDTLSIGRRYRQLLAEFPMAWSVNVTIIDLIGHADLGSSLGQVKVVVDRAWSSVYRAGNTQQFVSGFDHIDLTCEGRVSADAKIKGISKRITVFWNDIKNVPLIQFAVDLNALDISLGIDGHRFLVGKATRWRAGFLNKLITITSGAHELFVSAQMDDISIALTSLVASNIYDVIEPLNFLRAQTAIYQKSLDRGGEGNLQKVSPAVNHILAKLRIRLAGQVNRVSLYVFPTNFEDSTALKVRANLIKFVFDRKIIVQDILPSYLEIESYGIKVGLVGGTRAAQNATDFFKKLQSRTVSSILVNIPHASVSMDSTDIESRRVEYIFKSAFHGDVEVGWNLGTLNFIRELYETHERTWVSRIALKERAAHETSKRRPQTIKEFMEEQRPDYVPTSTPEIHIPNLHDMGHATPPVEWIGFNRERLPGMIHWFAIRALNKMIGDIELEYGKLLY